MNAATFAGNLTANGNIVLGNASSDTLSFTGAITLGLLSTLTMAIGAAATPSLNFTSSTTTGFSCAAADTLIVSTAATARMTISSAGLITIGTGGVIANVLGAVTVPSYSFTGDLNTGMWSSGADTLDFSTAGSQRIRIDSSGYVGINTATPITYLNVVTESSSAPLILDLYNTSTSGANILGRKARGTAASPSAAAASDQLCGLFGTGYYTSGGTSFGNNVGAIIIHAAENFTSSAQGTYIVFSTTATGAVTRTERMRIDQTGQVGIGATSMDAKLVLQAPGATGTHLIRSIKNSAGNTRITEIFDADSVYWQIGNRSSVALFTVDEVNEIVLLNKGKLKFPATQAASTDVNTLDDYEEGTWTPSPSASIPGGTPPTFGTCAGHYTKIGNTVHLKCVIPITANGTGSGEILVANMPFTVGGSGYSIAYGRETALTGKMLQGYENGATIHVINYDNTYPGGTGYSLSIHMTYIV